jgi:hypothetical protein
MYKDDIMQKTAILSFAAVAALASADAIARNPVNSQPPRSEGSGVVTDATGALVRPGFTTPGGYIVVKAGTATSTSCHNTTGYSRQGWAAFDRWGSFSIPRPANVVGEVRYCVSVQANGRPSFEVKYDAIGP